MRDTSQISVELCSMELCSFLGQAGEKFGECDNNWYSYSGCIIPEDNVYY